MARVRQVAALLCALALGAAFVANAAFTPPPASQVRYCNTNPPPIPALSAESLASSPKLEQVSVFIRHGARTPAIPHTCWADDSAVFDCELELLQLGTLTGAKTPQQLNRIFPRNYINGGEVFPGNCGVGALTAEGRHQQLMNGKNMRDAYITGAGLLPETYEEAKDTVFLRSDDSTRTKMSGQALFDGLYPPSGDGDETVTIPWHIRDEAVDDILPNPANCPNLSKAKYDAAVSDEGKKLLAEIAQKLAIAKAALNSTVESMGNLFDCTYEHVCRGDSLPSGMTEDLYNTILALNPLEQKLLYAFNNSRVARYGQGPLIAELRGNLRSIMNGSANANKFWLYAGHDTGPIMPMLAAFDVFDGKWCPYAGYITFELYSTNSGYAVRMVYFGEVMNIPGCGNKELCNMRDFETVLERIIPTSYECGFPSEAEAANTLKKQSTRTRYDDYADSAASLLQ